MNTSTHFGTSQLLAINPGFSFERWGLSQLYKDLVQLKRMVEYLRQAGLP